MEQQATDSGSHIAPFAQCYCLVFDFNKSHPLSVSAGRFSPTDVISGTVEVSKGCLAPTDPMVSHILGPLVSPAGARGGSGDGYRRKLQEHAAQLLVPWPRLCSNFLTIHQHSLYILFANIFGLQYHIRQISLRDKIMSSKAGSGRPSLSTTWRSPAKWCFCPWLFQAQPSSGSMSHA